MSSNLFPWRTKLIYILDGLRVRTFSANFHFGVMLFVYFLPRSEQPGINITMTFLPHRGIKHSPDRTHQAGRSHSSSARVKCVYVSAELVPAAPGHGTNSEKTQTPPGDLSQPVDICILLVPWGPPHMVPSWHADSEVVEDMLGSLVTLIFVSPADSWPHTHAQCHCVGPEMQTDTASLRIWHQGGWERIQSTFDTVHTVCPFRWNVGDTDCVQNEC